MGFTANEPTSECNPKAGPLTNCFGIYVHIPFCKHRCSYCDFYSLTQYDAQAFSELTRALIKEITGAAQWLKAERRYSGKVGSLFFGGGTPSLLPIGVLREILGALFSNFEIAPNAEITLEANPETVTETFCNGLCSLGDVNRVSLGAQSFNPTLLSKLERPCGTDTIVNSSILLKDHGFENFNLDLIFGIPGQTPSDYLSDIDRACDLKPKHISSYALSLKPGHPLYYQLPEEEVAAEMLELGIRHFGKKGFVQYEISNFSKSGYECRHNLLYWSGGDFLGVGPSAASRFFWDGTFYHRKQVADLKQYFHQRKFPDVPFDGNTRLQTLLEAAFLELRKNKGVDLEYFSERYGYDLGTAKKYHLFLNNGLLLQTGPLLRLSSKGILLADSVTQDLIDL